VNAVHLSGTIGQHGVKLSYTEQAKPQTSFTLIVEEGAYKTFVPVLIVGTRAEELAETLEAEDRVELSGKLTYKAGRTQDAGKLMVVGVWGGARLPTDRKGGIVNALTKMCLRERPYTESKAKVLVKTVHAQGPAEGRMHAYHCICGAWHVAHQGRRARRR
jgi:hypothetical protein